MGDSGNCVRHLFERATHHCDHCGNPYCDSCVVRPFPKRPPLCKWCAMAAAGVRSDAKVRPVATPKELKAMAKARAQAAKVETEAARQARPDRSSRTARSVSVPGPVNPSQFITDADVVPPILGSTAAPPRTKRLWRTAG